MKCPRFVLAGRALVMVALLLVVNPVFAKSDRWPVFTDASSLVQAMSADQKAGTSRFVVVFVADWAIQARFLEEKISSLKKREFPGHEFLLFDVTQHRKDQVQLQNKYGVSGAPAVVVLDRSLKPVRGKRVCGDIWKNTKDFANWLRQGAADERGDHHGCAPVKPDNLDATVGIKVAQDSGSLLVTLDIPQGFYLPYDRISLKVGSANLELHDVGLACSSKAKVGLYFKNHRVCENKAQIRADMKDLRHAGCDGRADIILKYQKYYYPERVLFPAVDKTISVDCG